MAPAFSKVCPAKLIAMAIHKLIQERVMIVSILADRCAIAASRRC
jgi:hypothetical protein